MGRGLLASGLGFAVLIGGCGKGTPEPPAIDSSSVRKERELNRRIAALDDEIGRADLRPDPAEHRRARDAPARGDASALARLDGEVAYAIATPNGDIEAGGAALPQTAWSTIKVPVVLAVLEEGGGPAGLSAEQASQIEAALSASDNEAAAALFTDLIASEGGTAAAAARVGEVIRAGGDPSTVVSTTGRDGFSSYGQTVWPLEGQARFMAELFGGCASDPESSAYVLAAMGHASEGWGLGSLPGAIAWKGGWGPEPDGGYLLRQMGAVETPSGTAVVAIAARATDGRFESGQHLLSELAATLEDRLRANAPLASC